MKKEVLELLDPQPGETVVDGTVGNGGHSEAFARCIGSQGVLVGIDLDTDALRVARKALAGTGATIHLVHGSFRHLTDHLAELHIEKVDKVLLDLGLRTEQIRGSGRGFSFQSDEPLVMTFSSDPEDDAVTAWDVVNRWEEENLADIIYGFGGERHARKIARAIREAREKKDIETSGELAEIIRYALPPAARRGKIHPATRTFQAIRMAVNDELGALEEGLESAWNALVPGGRIAVISFHSLEDRTVKNFVRSHDDAQPINKKPLRPTSEEIHENPPSRSARLRVFQKQEQ